MCDSVVSRGGWLLHDECRHRLPENVYLQTRCHQLMVLIPIDDIMSEDNRLLNADGDIQMKEQPSMIQLVLELVLKTQGRACVCVCARQHAAHNCNSVR